MPSAGQDPASTPPYSFTEPVTIGFRLDHEPPGARRLRSRRRLAGSTWRMGDEGGKSRGKAIGVQQHPPSLARTRGPNHLAQGREWNDTGIKVQKARVSFLHDCPHWRSASSPSGLLLRPVNGGPVCEGRQQTVLLKSEATRLPQREPAAVTDRASNGGADAFPHRYRHEPARWLAPSSWAARASAQNTVLGDGVGRGLGPVVGKADGFGRADGVGSAEGVGPVVG